MIPTNIGLFSSNAIRHFISMLSYLRYIWCLLSVSWMLCPLCIVYCVLLWDSSYSVRKEVMIPTNVGLFSSNTIGHFISMLSFPIYIWCLFSVSSLYCVLCPLLCCVLCLLCVVSSSGTPETWLAGEMVAAKADTRDRWNSSPDIQDSFLLRKLRKIVEKSS